MIRFKETTILFYRQLAYAEVVLVSDVNDSLAVDGQSPWLREQGHVGRAVLITALTGNTDYRAHYTFRRNLPDAVIFGIRDIKVLFFIQHQLARTVELRIGCQAVGMPGTPLHTGIYLEIPLVSGL